MDATSSRPFNHKRVALHVDRLSLDACFDPTHRKERAIHRCRRHRIRPPTLPLTGVPKCRIGVPVVADVVAVVGVWRAIDRREPHDVDPQPLEAIEPVQNAAEIADAVAVGVLEAPRLDMVDEGGLPPVGGDAVGRGGRLGRCWSRHGFQRMAGSHCVRAAPPHTFVSCRLRPDEA